MTEAQAREAARQFYYRWKGRGQEDEDARSYWIEILQNILGADRVTERVEFEKKVLGKRIDVYIPETRVLIEQKSLGIPLDKSQAGHDGKTPYEQALEYNNGLPFSEKARWIITSNFAEIWIYDMDQKKPEPVKVSLDELQSKFHVLDFLVRPETAEITEEVELSKQAGELVGVIHDRFLKQYNDPLAKRTQRSLNVLCVRLVFLYYAEDSGLLGEHDAFSRYVQQYEPKDLRNALLELFKVLDTPTEERADLYLSDELAAFPYVNGGLFADENIVIPRITTEIKETLIESSRFDWSRISPTIFGAVFESTLNPETRRAGGMHYTSIENIHKVIDPLFLDDLKAEFEAIKADSVVRSRDRKLKAFQEKLGSLKFLDPAAGSGNFLTETYLSLRRLENEAVRVRLGGQMVFGEAIDPIKVSISQFYGIEINDFAVTVARTALWIAESQMMIETESIVRADLEFLPLKTQAHIVEGNALQTDWDKVVSHNELSYILGNPPFVGYSMQTREQKADILSIYRDEAGRPYKTAGKIDYVSAWYWKAAEMMKGTRIRAAFVSTNSITQGEQVAAVWRPLYQRFGIHIDFAYRTFIWSSEAADKASVHVVIVGFSAAENNKGRVLYTDGIPAEVDRINAYLVNAEDVFIEGRNAPLCDVPVLLNGGKPTEGGFLILTEEEKDELLKKEPQAAALIRPYMMGKDFIQRRPRFCLWMAGINPGLIKQCPLVMERIEKVRSYRLQSPKAATQKKAETPMLFDEVRECKTDYVAIPKVSSERRRYVPIEYLKQEVIPGDSIFMMEGSSLYDFGILTSNVHMAWMRAITGRLKSDYRYSVSVVYNNFPWPEADEAQRERITATAQGILDARALYPEASLADLYDPLTMPPELRRAHAANDRAVMEAYGMPIKTTDEAACVAWLMRLYQDLVSH